MKRILCLLCTSALCIILAAFRFSVPAMHQPASIEEYFISVTRGEILLFQAADLERRMQMPHGTLNGVTVTALPDPLQGSLVLEGVALDPYQFLTRSELDELCFVPHAYAACATVQLLPQGAEQTPCQLSISVLDQASVPPVIQSTHVQTVAGIPLKGTIDADYPQGGQLDMIVTQAPAKGMLSFEQTAFVYTPYPGQTGADSFHVYAVDRFGEYSNEIPVYIQIESNPSHFLFTDMQTNPSAYAAYKLHQAGILSGEKIGEHWFFQPEGQVSRGQFLVMLLAAAGKDHALSPTVNTGLPNDAGLPMYIKPYLQAAIEEGIWQTEHPFDPTEIPSRAEAVQMTALTANIRDVKDYTLQMADLTTIPAWALPYYKDLAAYKMLDLHTGCAYPAQALDRAYAADLLWQLCRYAQNR